MTENGSGRRRPHRQELGLYRRLIQVASLLIPASLRRDWRREWEAELVWRSRQRTGDRSIRRRSGGRGGREDHGPSGSDPSNRAASDRGPTGSPPATGDLAPALLFPALGAVADALWLWKEEWRRSMILQDLRYAVRTLSRRPGFVAVVVGTLALGIGANTAIFGLVDGALLRSLPYGEPDRLVRIWGRNTVFGDERQNVNYLDLLDWRQSRLLPDIAAINTSDITFHGSGDPVQITHGLGTANLFEVLGVEPVHGRTFAPGEDEPGNHRVVVLSHSFWSSSFGADPGAVGREIRLAGEPYTIVGVLPPEFRHPTHWWSDSQPALWRPVPYDVGGIGRGGHFLNAVGRLAPGTTIAQAQEELDSITAGLEDLYPDTNTGWRVELQSLRESIVGDTRSSLMVLMGAVGFLALIACANVANLLLARGLSRRQELAVRAALGAGRTRLVRQLVTESILLAAAGGALGSVAALWLTRWLLAGSEASLQLPEAVSFDLRTFVFTAGLSLLTGLAFGVVPSFHATRPGGAPLSSVGGRVTEDRRQRLWRSGLVTVEVALSLVLLVGAALLVRSYWLLSRVDPGLDPEGLITVRLTLPGSAYPEWSDRSAFYGGLDEGLAALPGVQAFGAVDRLPFGGSYSCDSFGLEDRPAPPLGEEPCAEIRFVRAEYFESMGIGLLEGRVFNASDDAEAPPVIVVNRTFADTWWPDGGALGKRFKYGSRDGEGPWRTIVGVVDDVRHFGLDEPPQPEVYFPHSQYPVRSLTYALRLDGDPEGIVGAVRALVADLDPALPIYGVATMEELIAGSVAEERFRTLVLGTFATTAVLLAVVGLYSVLATAVNQRRHELGVRMALGARATDVVRLVMRRGLLLTGVGIGLGLAGALALTRLLHRLLFEVSPSDPLTFAAVATLLVSVAAAACWVPARRATRVDPVSALRGE